MAGFFSRWILLSLPAQTSRIKLFSSLGRGVQPCAGSRLCSPGGRCVVRRSSLDTKVLALQFNGVVIGYWAEPPSIRIVGLYAFFVSLSEDARSPKDKKTPWMANVYFDRAVYVQAVVLDLRFVALTANRGEPEL
ncbi:unnamed protein product [Effrenium voratum]|uniref:Uncharacterized protein n=1 Tax=Effrenium voratum TaxID=2562239 RepID=A0AA36HRT5_9DINO|nr:unnamed protein product [Effrenium voratum]CAJ1446784.1 unnamed protein product [Effrenium voratum]